MFKQFKSLPATGIALIYAAIASIWIVASSLVLDLYVNDQAMHARLEFLKGLAFVSVTSVLLYVLLRSRQRAGGTAPPAAGEGTLLREARHELPLMAALALSVPLLGAGVYLLHSTEQEEETLQDLAVIASLKAGVIENWLAERRADGESLRTSGGYRDRYLQMLQPGNALAQRFVIDRLQNLISSYSYSAVTALDAQGRTLLALGNHPELPDQTRQLLAGAMRSNSTVISPLQRHANGELHLDIIVPLQDPRNQRPIGAIVLNSDPGNFLFSYLQTWPTTSPSGETMLVRRDGNEVQFLNQLRHRQGVALEFRQPLSNDKLPAAIAVTHGRTGPLRGVDYRGHEVLGAHQQVEGTDWHLVAKIDRSEALASSRALAGWVSLIALFAVSVIAVAMLLLARRQRQVQAHRLMQQFYNLPFIGMAITSPSTKRWLRFNDRLCDIFGYSREELAQLDWAQITHPEDLASDMGKFERVLRGESDGYAMDKRFIRKDGRVIFASIDVKCVRRPDAGIDYFVAMVQDITERKLSEARILKLSRLYATLSRCNAAIVHSTDEQGLFDAVCKATVESGGLKMAWIGVTGGDGRVEVVASAGAGTEYLRDIRITVHADDPHGRGPTGTAIREDKSYWCQDYRHDPATAPWHEHGARYGWGASAALPLHRGGRAMGALTLYLGESHAFDEETQTLLTELTGDISFALDHFAEEAARLKAEMQLRSSEERYRLLLENSLDAVLLTDPASGAILSANPAACRLFGRSEQDIINGGRAAIVNLSDARLAAALEQRRLTGQFRGELSFLGPDGRPFPAEVSTTIFQDSHGQPRTSMIIRDISERKRTETQLKEQLEELMRWQEATIGRESRILDLKREINALLESAGKPPRYSSVDDASDSEQPARPGAPT